MTKKMFLAKFKQLAKDHQKALFKEAEKLYDSGAIDTDSYLQDFQLAKIIMHVALLNQAEQYKPLYKNKAILHDIVNLKYF